MDEAMGSITTLFESLRERSKELNCLYAIEGILQKADDSLECICRGVIKALPSGMQYPDVCQAMIELCGDKYYSRGYTTSPWSFSADIISQENTVGVLTVSYTAEMPAEGRGPFLKDEQRLINTVAGRLGYHLTCHLLRCVAQGVQSARDELSITTKHQWRVIMDLLHRTERDLFYRIARKMLNHLCWKGIDAGQRLIRSGVSQTGEEGNLTENSNRPGKPAASFSRETVDAIFNIATEHLENDEILACLRKWIQENKFNFVVQAVSRHLTLPVVADALRRYQCLESSSSLPASPVCRGVEMALIRRFFSDRLTYIDAARDSFRIGCFVELLPRLIHASGSHGKLGFKSAGLYLADRIMRSAADAGDDVPDVIIPHTWHITSDVLLYFMHYNNLDNLIEQEYKEIHQVRREYPHIVQMFRRAQFPPDILKGLSQALDDFENHPIIVRSSSLLAECADMVLTDKYTSRILPNQGTKDERLGALTDAIAEVYASTFGPDPIACRTAHGLLDLGEEMGIIIQAVVGTRVGCYFLPAFTGAASSINECRWSARLKREDGLLRLVPGLGTRLAHYSADECPVFAVPAKPGSQDPATIRENVCRAPKRIDVINLESETVETVLISELLKKYGAEYPEVQRIFSTENGDHTPQPLNGTADFSREKPIVTFDGLLTDSRFMKQLELILRRLAARLNTPVEFEFASDGRRLYLLKCQTHDPAYTADGAKSPFGSYPAAAIRRADPWERCLPMVRQLAAGLDSERFGECKLYIANNERTAQSASTDPIDIFVLGRGTDDQRELLQLWIEGWMLCLDETYALKYGPQNGNLLQIHLVNENDPAGQTTHRDLREAAHHGFISLPCGRNSRT